MRQIKFRVWDKKQKKWTDAPLEHPVKDISRYPEYEFSSLESWISTKMKYMKEISFVSEEGTVSSSPVRFLMSMNTERIL